MKIKCVITDDEPFARKGLEGYVNRIDFLELVEVCEDAIQLNTALKSNDVDLIFLDIEMPYITGIEFLQNLRSAPAVIFTTAYEKYAVEGFNLDIVDYLVKPISFDRFLKAANKAFDQARAKKTNREEPEHLFIKTDNKIERVWLADILFAEARENYVTIYTHERKYLSHLTLKILSGGLPTDRFCQPHKSYIVSIDKISSIEGNILHVDQYQVPVSKHLKEEVMEKILQNRFLKR